MIDIVHHFAAGAYIKETFISQGMLLKQHKHPHAHLAILAIGTVHLKIGDVTTTEVGPKVLNLAADIAHEVVSLTDAVWYCVWGVPEELYDPETVDQTILEGA